MGRLQYSAISVSSCSLIKFKTDNERNDKSPLSTFNLFSSIILMEHAFMLLQEEQKSMTLYFVVFWQKRKLTLLGGAAIIKHGWILLQPRKTVIAESHYVLEKTFCLS